MHRIESTHAAGREIHILPKLSLERGLIRRPWHMKPTYYALLWPALLLTSQIILLLCSLSIIRRCQHPGSQDDLGLMLSPNSQRGDRKIPDIDFNPDTDPNPSSFAITTLFSDWPTTLADFWNTQLYIIIRNSVADKLSQVELYTLLSVEFQVQLQ